MDLLNKVVSGGVLLLISCQEKEGIDKENIEDEKITSYAPQNYKLILNDDFSFFNTAN
jgi:hypothetical protein